MTISNGKAGQYFMISHHILSQATQKASELPLLKNSIRNGEGSVVAFIGEHIACLALDGLIKNTYDYDLIYGIKNDFYKWILNENDVSRRTVDVKTKERTVPPRPYYNCTVADFNTSQKCDEYAFVSVHKNLRDSWYLGKISKNDFYAKASFSKKGDPETSRFKFRADCYNIKISELEL